MEFTEKNGSLHLKSCSGSNKFSYSCNGNRPGQQIHFSRQETEQSDEEEIAEVSDYEALRERLLMQKKLRQRTRALMRSQRKAQRENTEEEASGADEFTAKRR